MSKILRPEEVPLAVASFNLADFEAEGQEIVRRAREEAERLLAGARTGAAEVSEEARKSGLEAGRTEGLEAGRTQGHAEGLERGLAEAAEKTATLNETLKSMVEDLGVRRAVLVKEAERDLLGLALGVAGRILRRELQFDNEAAARAVVEAMALVADRTRVTVSVNPADLAAVEAARADLTRTFTDAKDIGMVADESVERGGCRLTTEGGAVDMQVATQLERIERLLLGEAKAAETPEAGETGGEGGQ